MENNINIEFKLKDNIISIFINKLLHLKINISYVDAIHSYIEDEEVYKFKIDIHFKNKETLLKLEYDTKEKWEKILNILNEC